MPSNIQFKNEEEQLVHYQKLMAECTGNMSELNAKLNRFSIVRLTLLLVEIGFFIGYVSVNTDVLRNIFGFLLFVPIVIFILIVRKQQSISSAFSFQKKLKWIFENEINMMLGRANGYSNGSQFENISHPFSSDLDVFGKGSIFELINRCSTEGGIQKLAVQLSSSSTKVEMEDRQEAVKEMRLYMTESFNFRAHLKGENHQKIEQIKSLLIAKLPEQLEFIKKPILRVYIKMAPYLTFTITTIAAIFGGQFWGLFSLLVLIHASLIFYFLKKINRVHFGFGGGAVLLNSYAEAIRWIEGIDWKANYLRSTFNADKKASEHIKALSKNIQRFDARLNFLLAAVLNFYFLWDLRCCLALVDWQKESASVVVKGIDSIPAFEEIVSLANLAYNRQQWTFPKISNEFVFLSEDLGHPLIQSGQCVVNNYSLADLPTVDLITGSNMAGKSTFLRSVGANLVLAYAGAPVFAKSMTTSIFQLLTYMRIKDSLNESTSTFKAELNRLKMILDETKSHKNSLVLIDEMLRGTNSKDKFSGSKVFIKHMIKAKIPMLFATHDLQLSSMSEEYPNGLRNFHFDIQFNRGEMMFDYKIKPGPCSIFNASLLLEQIGLSLDDI